MSAVIKTTVFIWLGSLAAGLGLKGFLIPNQFIDGGITGISMLISHVSGLPLAGFIILINIPFLFLAYQQLGKNLMFNSLIAIITLSIVLWLIPFPIITTDKLLVASFGGFFLGLGIGLAVRGGAVLDGTEILAIYASKNTGLTIGDIILILNILIFSVAAYLLSIETSLYAILTYLVASRTLDFVIEGFEEYLGVTIISEKSEEIRKMIVYELGHGVTVYKGTRGFETSKSIDIIFTVITRLEVSRLQNAIQSIDSKAFIIMHSIKDTRGGMIKKRAQPSSY